MCGIGSMIDFLHRFAMLPDAKTRNNPTDLTHEDLWQGIMEEACSSWDHGRSVLVVGSWNKRARRNVRKMEERLIKDFGSLASWMSVRSHESAHCSTASPLLSVVS